MTYKKWLKENFLIATSILVGVLAFLYIYLNISLVEALTTLVEMNLFYFTAFIVTTFLIQLILSYRWLLILRTQGIKHLGLLNVTLYRLTGFAVSFLTPTARIGGEAVRATVLSQREDIEFKKSLSGVVVDKTLEFSTSILVFVVGLIYLLVLGALTEELRMYAIPAIIVLSVLVAWYNWRVLRGYECFYPLFNCLPIHSKWYKKFLEKVQDFEDYVLKFYYEEKKMFFYCLAVSFFSWGLIFFEYYFAALAIGISLNFWQIFLVFIVINISFLIPIPMALGVLEAGQIAVFRWLNLSNAAAISFTIIIRIKDVLLSLIGLIALVKYGYDVKYMVSEASKMDGKHEFKK